MREGNVVAKERRLSCEHPSVQTPKSCRADSRRNRSKEQLRATARIPEVLIPIRLDYEHEAYKLRDTFTWNMRGQ